jgi:type I restriction enzyme M protein
MFVQSEEFIEKHGGRIGDLSIYGQESNPTTWKLAKMNLALRGIEANLGPHHADTFRNDLHKDLRADFVLANPPFNMSDWGGENLKDDIRWKYGVPPTVNANFAWVQHMVHHLAPAGIAGFVLANGSMSSNQSGEGEIRRRLIEDDLVGCMISLPGQLFYGSPIPVCLWFIVKTKRNGKFADRRAKTLFIDARKMGLLVDRVHRDLTDEEITRIAETYHAWRAEKDSSAYRDIPGFCNSATLEAIRQHKHVLTPGRYVGAEETIDDNEPFETKMMTLTSQLRTQFKRNAELEIAIDAELKGIGL